MEAGPGDADVVADGETWLEAGQSLVSPVEPGRTERARPASACCANSAVVGGMGVCGEGAGCGAGAGWGA